jgi:hypothetical protein
VKSESGNVTRWLSQTGAPDELVVKGWRKNDLKAGDQTGRAIKHAGLMAKK